MLTYPTQTSAPASATQGSATQPENVTWSPPQQIPQLPLSATPLLEQLAQSLDQEVLQARNYLTQLRQAEIMSGD
jgi:hypothetical protein